LNLNPKSGTHFHFQQFSVRHDHCSMKVGTDAVLLGAWINIHGASTLLDIGTGSGVIALMLAQRTAHQQAALIDAVELEATDAAEALENAAHSPWAARLRVHHTSIQQFQSSMAYDVVVSNPPFFNNSLMPPAERRGQTRHTITLDHRSLIHEAVRLLAPQGTFNVILPVTEGNQLITVARQAGLHVSRQYAFRTRREKPVERLLLEFAKLPVPIEEGEILLYGQGQEWDDSYRKLTEAFYLKK
jgi:tRNA1Val (adenine37-N6)-methyltransferase